MKRNEVLIVGAGPTGLVLALWLTKQGVKVRIIDKNSGPGPTSRAMAVQARTLELYRQLDLDDDVVEAGYKNPAFNIWVRGKQQAHVSYGSVGADLTPYPFVLIYPQDQHELLLIKRLELLGVTVERQTELLDFEDESDHILARIKTSTDNEELCETNYIAGCDGARSLVRSKLGSGFPGGTYKHIFYVADVEIDGVAANGEIHLAIEGGDFVAIFPCKNNGFSRLVGTVNDEREEQVENLTFDDISHQAIESLNLRINKVNWFSTYRVHHRVADHFRKGRVFLLGDAAHVHSPAGGQGMNTGIGDAINLAWKLASVLRNEAPDSLLDSYESERLTFARKLVETTDRVFSFVTAEGNFADFVRTWLAPAFASFAYKIDYVRELAFRTISQTSLNYHDSPLSKGMAGEVKGGGRLPWVKCNSIDNYDALKEITWQVHVYGAASQELRVWCEKSGLPIHIYNWHEMHEKAGFVPNAAYLLRPDSYIAMVDSKGMSSALESYFNERGIRWK